MTKISADQAAQLERIARLLGQNVESFFSADAGIAILSELLEIWPRLSAEDRRSVLAFAKSRDALRAGRA